MRVVWAAGARSRRGAPLPADSLAFLRTPGTALMFPRFHLYMYAVARRQVRGQVAGRAGRKAQGGRLPPAPAAMQLAGRAPACQARRVGPCWRGDAGSGVYCPAAAQGRWRLALLPRWLGCPVHLSGAVPLRLQHLSLGRRQARQAVRATACAGGSNNHHPSPASPWRWRDS